MVKTTAMAVLTLVAASAMGDDWRIAKDEWRRSGDTLMVARGQSNLGRTWYIYDRCGDEFGWTMAPFDPEGKSRLPAAWMGLGYSLVRDAAAGLWEGWTVPVVIETDRGFRDELVVNVSRKSHMAYRWRDDLGLADHVGSTETFDGKRLMITLAVSGELAALLDERTIIVFDIEGHAKARAFFCGEDE